MGEQPPITRSGSEKRQRSVKRDMRLTPGELAQLHIAAERAGMTVASFMRHQCLRTPAPRAARRPPVEIAALSQLLGWVGRCSGNLNQIAKIGNTTGDLPPGVQETLAELRAAARAIMTALGKRDV